MIVKFDYSCYKKIESMCRRSIYGLWVSQFWCFVFTGASIHLDQLEPGMSLW